MADYSFRPATPGLDDRLRSVVDREGKIPRALEALGPIAGRDVVLLDSDRGVRAEQLASLGARVTAVRDRTATALPPGSAELLVAFWTLLPGGSEAWERELAGAEHAARRGGRLLLVEDYARDDVALLVGDERRAAELVSLTRRDGWFLTHGFRIRVLHCWWTFDSLDEARELLAAGFGERGASVAAGLRRPRLSYKVAVLHRDLGGSVAEDAPVTLRDA